MATTMTSVETQAPDHQHKHKPPTKIRKRAPKACLSCRARKVRCDVSQRGRPCMNCYLDSEACVVTGRASRFRRPQRETGSDHAQASHPPYSPKESHACASSSAEAVVKSRMETLAEPAQTTQDDMFAQGVEQHHDRRDSLMTDSVDAQPQVQVQVNNNYPDPTKQPSNSTWPGDTPMGVASDVVYSYYPFLSMGNLANIPPQDVNYLEQQGCLRVPTRALLDEFLQQYFLHVHPLLPLLNEGDFWELYCHNTTDAGMPSERMSLLVLQAVLFASCNFVSRGSVRALGHANIRAARAALYRRAKLLYDLETESSAVSIAQAALLLSFWSPSNTRNPNTSWLSLAVQHAKSADAHHYAAMAVFSAATHPMQHRKQNMLKKVWWCCVIRDRTLGLLMRRPIQITKAHFDFDSNPILGFADLDNEFERSRVYNPGTKRTLAEMLAQLLELYVVLTDIIMLVFPLDDAPGWGRRSEPEDAQRVQECKTALRRWHKSATSRFPLFGRGSSSSGGGGAEFQHDSVILYTNLMYMYYHSSRVVLAHHEMLHVAVQATPFNNSNNNNTNTNTNAASTLHESRHELQDAAAGVTECLKELVHLKLARWLPISAVACTALPLVLNILDVKLSASAESRPGLDANAASALKQHRLNILIEAMRTYQPQYDGVDWVSEIVRHVVDLAQVDDANPVGDTRASTISDWTDILALQPSSYLRLALALDVSLSKGRLPEDGDFPVSLRGLFVGGFSPLRALIEANRTAATGANPEGNRGHSESDSHDSSPVSQTDSSCQASHASEALATDGPLNTTALASEGIDGLGTNAFNTQEEESPGGTSEFEGMFLDGPMPDMSAEWIETVWDEMGNGEDRADGDIARMLLGALKEGDGGVGEVVV